MTKKLDAVTWKKPDSGGAITDGTGGYHIDVGTYQDESNSQTTVLTIPVAENEADVVYTCVITSNEHGKSADTTIVNSKVFSKYYLETSRLIAVMADQLQVTSKL